MELAASVTGYAHRFVAVHGDAHSISSPLGAWLVIAIGVQAAAGSVRSELEELLGLDAAAARAAVDDLLRHPPRAVRTALAAWTREAKPWIEGLPPAVERGDVPGQPDLDAWARDRTDGLIDRFPISDPASIEILLASALATRVSWLRPFGLVRAGDAGTPWRGAVTQVLSDADATGALIDTGVGTVGVHTAEASGLRVVSVIADSAAAPADVLGAAHDIATGRGGPPRPLADFPLVDRGYYSIGEEKRPGGDAYRAYLPAWAAASDHDLMADPTLGFGAVGRGVAGGSGRAVDATQCAVARYGQFGFDAAAITTVAVRSAFVRPRSVRVATLRFGHPYAVVAITTDGPWRGMPVFAAWVAEPSEPDEVVTGG